MCLKHSTRYHGIRSARWFFYFMPMVCAIGLVSCNGESTVVQEDARQAMAYPRRIVIPDDLSATEECFADAGKERTHVIFPIGIYHEGHYRGWQMFLSATNARGSAALNEEFKPPIMAVNESYTFRGMEAGYNDCKTACRQLAKSHSNDELKEMAGMAHRPLTITAPKPDNSEPMKGGIRPTARW